MTGSGPRPEVEVISQTEACQLIGVSRSTIVRALNEGKLTPVLLPLELRRSAERRFVFKHEVLALREMQDKTENGQAVG